MTVTCHAYPYYGGRGIKVCERWKDFANFLQDMGEKPAGMTIDRINVDGDYCPENCRWADAIEQMNNRRNVHRLTANGITDTIRGWSERTGLPQDTIYLRLKRGASHDEAVNRPYYSRAHQSAESKARKRKPVAA